MKLFAAAMIVGGIGNALYFPLHLIVGSEFSLILAAGVSVIGILLLVAGIGTWTRKKYGWKIGFVAIFAATVWCAAASMELILKESQDSFGIASIVAGIFLLSTLVFSGLWHGRRTWFETKSELGANKPE